MGTNISDKPAASFFYSNKQTEYSYEMLVFSTKLDSKDHSHTPLSSMFFTMCFDLTESI